MSDPLTRATTGELSALLKHLHRCGVTFLPKSDVIAPAAARATAVDQSPGGAPSAVGKHAPALPTTVPAAASSSVGVSGPVVPLPGSQPSIISVADSYTGPSLPLTERIGRLEELSSQVATCPRCEVLACSRKTTVFGEGDPAARVCFFGEAPGAEEDATGRPFVGRSGMLLTKMIEACTFSRQQVYILNTIKCRPPGNRNPEPVEIANCRPFFEQQFDLIRPEYIVCLGLVAAQTLLDSKLSIGRLRGRFHRYHDSKVLATYHPSYLLRNPDAKKEAWADLKLLMRQMGITPLR